ncbi:glycosyltransferase family 4 protein [Candidatus Bathyarchaeota archaeon A05DMB-2]|jgi:glycosyltransferase involved in cell wall biosynthesis|nr:glycosyltransferase family 4 protein [Candidatus Bathyarchaeota archaeon A05DMB-2]
MKVLLTSTDNPYTTRIGGKHIHLLLLERGLKKLNVEVATLYYKSSGIMELAKKGVMLPFSEKQQFKRKIDTKINYLVAHLPRHGGIDIIHAHDVLSMLATAKAPQKKVLTLHGYFARENVEFIKNERERDEVYPFLFETETKGMKNAERIITVDQRLKDYVLKEFKYPSTRVTVLYNSVDTDTFRPVTKEEQSAIKANAGFSRDNFIVLVPRRLVEKNGVIYAVRAMKHVAGENVRLIIAGDGPERQKILVEAAADQRIKLVGAVPHDEVASYYMMADSVLIPSATTHGIQEATSLAMLEGMSCGKAVICSEIGGMREIIQHMKNGILIKEKDPEEIARTISAIMNNSVLMSELSRNAREYVLQNHSYLAHAQKVLNIYHEVLEK